MSTKKGSCIADLIKNFMSRFSGKKNRPEANEPCEIIDGRNPWQYNLERLAAVEHTFNVETAAQAAAQESAVDSLTSFVTDLAKKSVDAENYRAPKSTGESQPPNKKLEKRLGDKTINDMKSWWDESLSPDNGQSNNNLSGSELPGKPRLLKRWFQ